MWTSNLSADLQVSDSWYNNTQNKCYTPHFGVSKEIDDDDQLDFSQWLNNHSVRALQI